MDPLASAALTAIKFPTIKTVVIYHANCADGACAAWCYKRLAERGPTQYYHTSERVLANDKNMPSLDGCHVVILDYAYSRAEIMDLRSRAASVLIIDHHASYARDLEGVPGVVMDTTKCAAELVWGHYSNMCYETPWFLQHIRDRDLWLWEHPDSRAFSAAFVGQGLKFEVFDKLNQMKSETEREAFLKPGRLTVTVEDRIANQIAKNAELVYMKGLLPSDKTPRYRVWLVESHVFRSEVGNILSARPDCDFAAVYVYRVDAGRYDFSLRGRKGSELDLGKVAKEFNLNGGGHPAAAGFEWIGNFHDIVTKIPADEKIQEKVQETAREKNL